jgi:DNA-binding transcriptional ArsR family regulator
VQQEIRTCAYLQGVTVFLVSRADLMKVRFASSPVWETEAAVRSLGDDRRRPYHETWRAAVAGRSASVDLRTLVALFPRGGFTPDFLSPPPRVAAPTLREQLDEIRATPLLQVKEEVERCRDSTPDPETRHLLELLAADPSGTRERLADTIWRAWRELVAPFWPRIRALLDADIAHRSTFLASHGLRRVLDDLDPRIRWGERGIEVDDGIGEVVDLAGRGLVLMPSAYIWPRVTSVTDAPWQPTIVYPARGIEGLWQRSRSPSDALAHLVGRTRAFLLVSLDSPTSTTALAALTELSPSGVSRHLIALRDAGLVSTARHGHEVRYSRTRLGSLLANTP